MFIQTYLCLDNMRCLLLVIFGYIAGIYLYSNGFLLSRRTLPMRSSCTDVVHSNDVCWMRRRYDRVIILLIDALRFDFVAPQSSASFSLHHHNRLTSITDRLVSLPKRTLLARFVADAPTTTMQRLKALTTGSLPTFSK